MLFFYVNSLSQIFRRAELGYAPFGQLHFASGFRVSRKTRLTLDDPKTAEAADLDLVPVL